MSQPTIRNAVQAPAMSAGPDVRGRASAVVFRAPGRDAKVYTAAGVTTYVAPVDGFQAAARKA